MLVMCSSATHVASRTVISWKNFAVGIMPQDKPFRKLLKKVKKIQRKIKCRAKEKVRPGSESNTLLNLTTTEVKPLDFFEKKIDSY